MTTAELRLSALKAGQRKLVRMMNELGHGRIEGLIVHRGRPVFNPAPRIIREIKLLNPQTQNKARAAPGDYVLKLQVVQLLETLEDLGDGRVESLLIADGLPVRVTVEGR
jgi:hypothetical protein